ALHAHFQVDVLEMDRHAGLGRAGDPGVLRRLLELCPGGVDDRGVVGVAEDALGVLLEDGAEDPAVAVAVRELSVIQFRIEVVEGVACANLRAMGWPDWTGLRRTSLGWVAIVGSLVELCPRLPS